MTKQKKMISVAIAIIIIIAIGFFTTRRKAVAPNLDAFAKCIADSGAKFYGAFWCSHCQNQKKLFGDSAKLLPYVECSTPDGQGQTLECKSKNIEGYPTWRFADGSEQSGELTLDQLSQKTGCKLN